jgi:hypothetical protein
MVGRRVAGWWKFSSAEWTGLHVETSMSDPLVHDRTAAMTRHARWTNRGVDLHAVSAAEEQRVLELHRMSLISVLQFLLLLALCRALDATGVVGIVRRRRRVLRRILLRLLLLLLSTTFLLLLCALAFLILRFCVEYMHRLVDRLHGRCQPMQGWNASERLE